jgi:two-component system, OmpR family, sensor histidine kinase KdpD
VTDGDLRPSPDALLQQTASDHCGKLKVYLGAAPGVGKTYEMLQDGQRKRADGVDVVVGVVETHGRKETNALCEGLEIIPRAILSYRGQWLKEMDLDAVLARKPAVALVDELAHTNVEGSRHPKRWQDIEELLDAGIHVWTTLNIQHLESLNDIVARITHVRVRETVPDGVLERADEIELVDITPAELMERLNEGKVYAPDQAQAALRNYFNPGNLAALRELAMRQAADRIDVQLRSFRQAKAAEGPWAAAERILVCVDERSESEEIVRHAKRLADRHRAAWIAVHVQTVRHANLSEAERGRIAATLRLAARLGAETATLPGDRIAETLLIFARDQNVTQIVVGKAKRPPLFEVLFGSVVRDLLNRAETIAIYVVPEEESGRKRRLLFAAPWPALTPLGLAEGLALTAFATLAAMPLDRVLGVSNLTLVFLGAVLISALTRGLWPGLITGLFSALAFNYFYTDPRYTFTIADPENVLAVIAFSGAAIVVSTLASRARVQTLAARAEAKTARELYGLARGLASVASEDEVAQTLAAYAARAFDAECVVLARVGVDGLRFAGTAPGKVDLADADMAAARWAMDKGTPAGRGADTLAGARWLFVPMRTARLSAGVIAIGRDAPLTPYERSRLDAFADQGATALERAHISRAYEEGRVEMEAERLRATMLSSLSHDLKTPIAGILGAASSLRAYGERHDDATRNELLASIEGEAGRLQRYVAKLLDMTRLDAGGVTPRREAVDVADVVAAAVKRATPLAEEMWIDGDVEPGLPMLKADATLLEQALFNLIENAVVHAREGGEVRVYAHFRDGVVIDVLDSGPGLPKGKERQVFEKFARAQPTAGAGTGLGLAIVKGFVDLMGARVSARNRTDRSGAIFTIEFPRSSIAES